MLETLKKISKKSITTRCIISLVIVIGCLVYSGMGIIQFIQGPKSLKNVEDISAYEGKYVSLDVEYIISDYLWRTSKNSETNIEKTTGMGYILYNYDTDIYFGFEIKTSDETIYDDFITQTWDYIMYDEGTAPESFTIKGTLKPIEGTALEYFNETVDEIFAEDYKDYVYAYYIDCDTLDGKDSIVVWMVTGVAVIALLFFIFNLIKGNSNGYMKYLNKYLAANTNLSLSTIEADFSSAERVGNIWIGKRWTIWMEGIYVRLINNETLVWAYYYHRGGRHPESKIITYDINKASVSINVSSNNADFILHNWSVNQPHIMIGYDKDVEKTYKKDFDTFLNYKYNIAKNAAMNQSNDAFSESGNEYYSNETASSSEEQ